MKHYRYFSPALLAALFIALLTQTGCRENTLIDAKISPSNNNVNLKEIDLPCITHTYFSDGANTSLNIGLPVYQAVGNYTDPFFGTMTGSTYFNIVPSINSATQYSGTTIDSAVLVLPYSGFTNGDSTNSALTQAYQVFYMLDTLGYNSTYYSNSVKPIDFANPLSDPYTVSISSIRDSLNVAGINYHPGIRIPLKLQTLLNRLMPAVNLLDNSTSPATDFVQAFKGICVRPADTRMFTSAIPYFELDGVDEYSEATIIVYHHVTGDTTQLQDQYYFNTGYCSHFNAIERSYSRSPLNNLLHSTQANDEMVAIQNQPGAAIDVMIPGIKSLPAGLINKADLMLSVLPNGLNSDTTLPQQLVLLGVGNGNYPVGITSGLEYVIADRYPISTTSVYSVLDGTMHLVQHGSTTIETYVLGLPREVMASVAASNDTIHLHINGSITIPGAYHLVAGGGNYSDTLFRAKLKVVYSTLK